MTLDTNAIKNFIKLGLHLRIQQNISDEMVDRVYEWWKGNSGELPLEFDDAVLRMSLEDFFEELSDCVTSSHMFETCLNCGKWVFLDDSFSFTEEPDCDKYPGDFCNEDCAQEYKDNCDFDDKKEHSTV